MAGRLDGKVAIVTGGATGIGGGTVLRLAEEGAKVLIADVEENLANERAEMVKRAGGTAAVLRADMTKHDDIRRMVEEAVSRFGRLDVVVNNAYGPTMGGDRGRGNPEGVSEEAWDSALGLLIKSMFLSTKYAVPEMRKAGGGAIVNISSVHGLLQARGAILYEVGKGAVISLTRQLAVEYGPDNIRVNAICPGHIVTERVQERTWKNNPSGLEFFAAQYPVRRTGKPVDIANGIVFLASEEASFITGHALVIDGGLTLQLQENFAVDMVKYVREHPDLQLPY
jgi:NAD(P)-dependent dehydrogenase (short-subunit alcohol dehydrogenase family)